MAEQMNESENQQSLNSNESIASQFLQQSTGDTAVKSNEPGTPAGDTVTEVIGNKGAADHWKVSVETIRDWVKDGMPISGPNNRRTFNLAECDAWLQERKDSPESQQPVDEESVGNVRETIRGPRRGDPCSKAGCPGKLISYSQSRRKTGRIYFLTCNRCNTKPKENKEVVSIF